MALLREIIEKNLVPREDFILGFAELHGLINKGFDGFNYGISIGKRLDDRIIDKIVDGPTIEYFNYYNNINKELAELTSKISSDMSVAGIESKAIEPTIHIRKGDPGYEEYLKTLTTDLSHKLVATRAGLGWIGKTDLFISEKFGPRLRLVSLLLKDDPGICSAPFNESKCGRCIVCVERCPASAASGKSWNIHTYRDEFFNAQKCRKMCAEMGKKRLNVDERICGICIAVCPLGKKINKNEKKAIRS